jgi:tetratricopeptide (TPR) repeat protein
VTTNNKITEEEVIRTLQQRLPEDKAAAALHNTLQQLNKEHFQAKGKLISFKKFYTVAAAAAVIILVTLLWWPDRDYMDEFGETQMIATIERGNSDDTALQQATVYFNRKDFAKALPLLEQAVMADTASQMALFYLGVAELHMEAIERARKNLEKVYAGESVFQHEAAFYLALSYTGQKDKAVAIGWLRKIPAGTPVSEKAGKLLRKLQ